MSNIFDIGIEQEFFLSKTHGVIYNASKLLEDSLGFSIDQNRHDSGEIKIDNNLSLRTDGTCAELQYFLPAYQFTKSSVEAMWNIFNKTKIVQDIGRCFFPYVENGDKGLYRPPGAMYHFDSVGDVYASNKTIRNAYTGLVYDGKKPEEGKKVTFRTAGIHVHFSLSNGVGYFGHPAKSREEVNQVLFLRNDYTHTDAIIKLFDECYDYCYGKYQDNLVTLREKNYQPRGHYRLKFDTKTKNPTIEYRQLAANQGYNLFEFISHCQKAAYDYLRKEKVI